MENNFQFLLPNDHGKLILKMNTELGFVCKVNIFGPRTVYAQSMFPKKYRSEYMWVKLAPTL